ncbi:MerR family transcriptional regulator [Pseudonocardia charpentierae]|uniref:MerR family transcriptional regulator n=1 Tax=Pseudonocardia charpentierae TaxID=3075545 RepID=A0ABU2NF72_9PSEU|nr:MerR family transcriptional regulator [Pseudonocardia sp. DSM 45834]MDT0352601.1 MerR family transcriptional regulator [Pseudonocardia sp. DSM 45834]
MGDADLPNGPAAPVWSAGAVARRLGIAPATLRSWNRRYRLGPATHQPGQHRRYTQHDVAVLEAMCRLVGEGVAPTAAADIARSHALAAQSDQHRTGQPIRPLEEAKCGARGLVLAALRLDAEFLTSTLDHHFGAYGVDTTWTEVCVPALTALGRRVTPKGDCVDSVHLLSWTIIAGLHRCAGPPASSRRRVLLACTDGERHSLGLEALHAVLTAQGIPARMLGASVPATALTAAAQRIRPAAVVLWSQASRTAHTNDLRRLEPTADQIIAAGPGWRRSRLPPRVQRVESLAAAMATIRDAVWADAPDPAPACS